MKHKDIIAIIIIFLIFGVLTFTTPYLDSQMSGMLWTLFFIIGGTLIVFLLLSISKIQKISMEEFKKQPKILQILDVLCIAALIYAIIDINNGYAIFMLIFGAVLIITFLKWFFKKEE